MGLLQSRRDDDINIVTDMLNIGLELEQISEITGLSIEEIEKIDKERKK